MGVPFLVRTTERVVVPAPQDDALTPEQREALLAYDLEPRVWPEGAATFTLRGLSASELAQLRPLLPVLPQAAAEAVRQAKDGTDVDAAALRLVDGWLARVSRVQLRAALVEVRGIDGWPARREEHLGLLLWPEETLDGLPPATVEWLSGVAYRLSNLAPEKKRPSSQPLVEPTGTTEASTPGAAPAGSC